ncbi:MAG: ABC transporter substrate-binding protein, partial [Alphaproteobacteria bacterium]|nr:ABC transporter substrate-binding protein [Alphaproteobacteria bacterium]
SHKHTKAAIMLSALLAVVTLWSIDLGPATNATHVFLPTSALARGVCNTDNKLCGDELSVFDWGGSDEPLMVPDYISKYPKKPRWSLFADSTEGLQKVKNGFQVDVAHITNSDIPFWKDYITPWEIKKIKNWDNLYSFWKKIPGFEPINGKVYGIPTYFGITTPIYDPDKVKASDLKSLKDFADPKYKGRVTMPDFTDEAYAFCMLAYGNKKPFSQMTKKDIDDCGPFLRALHKNVRVYWTDSASVVGSFKTGELWLGFVWQDVPYTINQARKNKSPILAARDLGFAMWGQAMSRLKTSKPEVDDLAYDFTNAMHSDRAAEFFVNEWSYGSANKKAMEKINPDIIKAHYLDGLEDYSKKGKSLMYGGWPNELWLYAQPEWQKIKSGQ